MSTILSHNVRILQALWLVFFQIFPFSCLMAQEKLPKSGEWRLERPVLTASEYGAQGEFKRYTEIIPHTKASFEMIPIQGGAFFMGSSVQEQKQCGGETDIKGHYNPAAESPRHKVKVAPFWMEKCEVTWDEFLSWTDHAPALKKLIEDKSVNPALVERYKLADAISTPSLWFDLTWGMGESRYPVICISPLGAQTYCKWLSLITGRYYRLPTEAEWEYACRAGTDTVYSFGNDPADLDQYAVYYENADEKYAKVGTKKPNPWGLYDMHGNVWEICLDTYDSTGYEKLLCGAGGKTLVNPLFWDKSQTDKYVLRGGSWDDDLERLRSAARWATDIKWNNSDPRVPKEDYCFCYGLTVGFRIVRPYIKANENEPNEKK